MFNKLEKVIRSNTEYYNRGNLEEINHRRSYYHDVEPWTIDDYLQRDVDMGKYYYWKAMELANIPQKYKDIVLTDGHQILYDQIRNANPRKIFLYNNQVGTGKTVMATTLLRSSIINQLIGLYNTRLEKHNYLDLNGNWDLPNDGDDACSVYFVNIRDYLYKKKRSMSDPKYREIVNSIEDKMLYSKVLVMDEIGSIGSLSDYDTNLLYVVCDERNNKNCFTVFTSNYTPDQFQEKVAPSLARRVLQDAILVEVK